MDLKEIDVLEKEEYKCKVPPSILKKMTEEQQEIYLSVEELKHEFIYYSKLATFAYTIAVQNQNKQKKIFWAFLLAIVAAAGDALYHVLTK